MLEMMLKSVNKKKSNQKGFTLVELIVVIAILGILAAIAIPRFQNISDSSKVKSDASTAAQIVNAARIQETDTGKKVVGLTSGTVDHLSDTYMVVGTPQSGGTWGLTGGGTEKYVVKWTPTEAGIYNKEQTVTEGAKFTPAK